MALNYRKHDGPYPFEVWFNYDAELISCIKKRIPFAERTYDRELRHWWFTETAFEHLCNEYCYLESIRNRKPCILEDAKEIILKREEKSDGFDLGIAQSWYAEGYEPMLIQKEILSKPIPNGYGLWFECGIGKTATAVCEFFRRRHEGRAKRMLVVVFRASLTINWKEDVKKLFDYEIDVIDSDMKLRAKKIAEAESLIVVTPFTTLGDESSIGAIKKHFDMLVCDEVHLFVNDKKTSRKKDGTRKKTRYWGLSQLCKAIPNRLALTGTPQPNKAINAYTPLMVCAPDKFPSKYMFTRRYAELDQWGKPKAYKNLNELKSYLAYYGMIALKKDYCDIPPKTEMNLYCEMGKKTEKVLKAAIHIQEGKTEDRLQLDDYYIRIHQLIACPSVYHDFKSDKIKVLKDYIDNDIPENEQIIVFASFKGVVKEVLETFGRSRCSCMIGGMTEKSEQIEYNNFKNGKKQILVATIQKMGVGFNLQCARHVFMYDTAMTGADYEQGLSRAWRIGQTNEVMVYNIIMNIPFDVNRYAIIEEQRKLWEKMSDPEYIMNSQQRIKKLTGIEKGDRAQKRKLLSQIIKNQ